MCKWEVLFSLSVVCLVLDNYVTGAPEWMNVNSVKLAYCNKLITGSEKRKRGLVSNRTNRSVINQSPCKQLCTLIVYLMRQMKLISHLTTFLRNKTNNFTKMKMHFNSTCNTLLIIITAACLTFLASGDYPSAYG